MEASWAAASAALTRLPFEDSKPDHLCAPLLHCQGWTGPEISSGNKLNTPKSQQTCTDIVAVFSTLLSFAFLFKTLNEFCPLTEDMYIYILKMWKLIYEQTGSKKTCLVAASTNTSVNEQHQREDAGVLQCSRETWATRKPPFLFLETQSRGVVTTPGVDSGECKSNCFISNNWHHASKSLLSPQSQDCCFPSAWQW